MEKVDKHDGFVWRKENQTKEKSREMTIQNKTENEKV